MNKCPRLTPPNAQDDAASVTDRRHGEGRGEAEGCTGPLGQPGHGHCIRRIPALSRDRHEGLRQNPAGLPSILHNVVTFSNASVMRAALDEGQTFMERAFWLAYR